MNWSDKIDILSSYEQWIEENPGFLSQDSSSMAVYDLAIKVAERYEQELQEGVLAAKALGIEDVRMFALSGSYLKSDLSKILEVIEGSHLSTKGKTSLKDSFKNCYETINVEKNGFFETSNRRISDSSISNPSEIVSFLIDAKNKARAGSGFDELARWLEDAYPLKNGGGEQAIMSEMLHVLSPETFPITNGPSNKLWAPLIKNYSSLSYPERFKAITELRDSTPWWTANPNYRLFDVFGWLKESSKEGDNSIVDTKKDLLDIGLNTILYGPPGTGKTYSTTKYAVAICEGVSVDKAKEACSKRGKTVRERFEELKEQGRIEFVTFHQSYGYEEFVEGIKPVLDSSGSDVSYTLADGVFKKICERSSSGVDNEKEFDQAWNKLINAAQENNGGYTFTRRHTRTSFDADLAREDMFSIPRPKSESRLYRHNVKRQWLEQKERPGEGNGNDWTYDAQDAIVLALQELGLPEKPNAVNANENHVLIIDEINRGNVSKIFGELITLIEDSKRIGGDDPMTVTLPYSPDEDFGVPSNLYILGTMNTADRSIALMDTALRRRFDFVEMVPDPYLVSEEPKNGVNVRKVMIAINKRIEALYDREHTIGHSYFMHIEEFEDLKKKFGKEIIPLLQEYFYDDYEKIGLVLADRMDDVDEGHRFILEHDIDSALFEGMDSELVPEKKIYEINADAFDDPLSYIKIYSMSEYGAAKE